MKNKVPDIRFSDFKEKWQTKPLNSYLNQSKEKNKNLEFTKQQVLSVASEAGVVNQIEYHGRSYAGKSVAPYGVLRSSDVVYTKSPLKSYPYGIIKFNRGESGIVSTLYATYKINNDVCGKFLDYYFYHAPRINRYLKPLVNIGAKNDMKVNNDYAISDPVTFPTLEEQKKIALFLDEVSKRICLLERNLEALNKYKKACMQKIFSKRHRFKDKNGNQYPDWETKKFSDIFDRVKRKNKENNNNVMTISGRHGLINQEEYFNKSVASNDVSGYYLLHKGEFAYNKSYSKGYPIGAIKRLTRYAKGVVSTLYICFKAKKDMVPEFYEHYFESGCLNKQIYKIAQEGARNHGLLNISVVEFFTDIDIELPHPDEQKKIANFLSGLDTRITFVVNDLERTKTFKKGLLQQMFV